MRIFVYECLYRLASVCSKWRVSPALTINIFKCPPPTSLYAARSRHGLEPHNMAFARFSSGVTYLPFSSCTREKYVYTHPIDGRRLEAPERLITIILLRVYNCVLCFASRNHRPNTGAPAEHDLLCPLSW